jgi:hypothetical protein
MSTAIITRQREFAAAGCAVPSTCPRAEADIDRALEVLPGRASWERPDTLAG